MAMSYTDESFEPIWRVIRELSLDATSNAKIWGAVYEAMPHVAAAELSRWYGPVSDGHEHELAAAMSERIIRLNRGDTTEVEW